MTEDLHAPTNAGPDVSEPSPEPPPRIGSGDGSWAPPAGPAGPERPEVLVGAAFAGGFVAALILKRLGR